MFTGQYIWLRFTVNGTAYTSRFRPVDVKDVPSKTGLASTGLRGNRYFHTLARYVTWLVVISADETYTGANKTFLLAFWYGDRQYISFSQSAVAPADNTFYAVDTGDGDAPRELIEDSIQIPEWSFTLATKKPLIWNAGTLTFDAVPIA